MNEWEFISNKIILTFQCIELYKQTDNENNFLKSKLTFTTVMRDLIYIIYLLQTDKRINLPQAYHHNRNVLS